eukprot:TRINITY_DN394_c0_g2_i2.p2 TRINITY_DN394_c0_g2~~TRINITY_DN394_c0_g2_i2.p2  ORF type:complete len:182 (-),score=29.08 TRINITY_DN394_c0_g2_i2:1189-1734(-)
MKENSLLSGSEELKKDKLSLRFNSFLNNALKEDLKRKNYDLADSLRKNQREKHFADKRCMPTLTFPPNFPITSLSQCLEFLHSPNIQQAHLGVQGVRKLLSTHSKAPIQEVIDAGIVPILINMIDGKGYNTAIQYEATWCMTNLAMGESPQVKCLVDQGAITKLIKLMCREEAQLQEQVNW